ncbi:MAG TPA: alpha/beta hydrolase [Burkholderiales bacterium]|nr:alpha/beta hydrolase [Burkholderiales bacterium]
MTHVRSADGTRIYCEENGAGPAVLFVHEYGGSCRSFDAQVAAFRARYRCIAFNARGYPPSEVPAAVDSYSQDHAVADIAAVMDGLGVEKAHLVGVSMGAASSLQFALKEPGRVLSATLVGIGSGSDDPALFRETAEANARLLESGGMAALAAQMSASPTRRRLKDKNPPEFRRFNEQLLAMSPVGHANTMRGVQGRRPPLYVHEKRLAALYLPVLVVVGEEDAGCRKPSEFLKRVLPDASLHVIPQTGHCVNLEDPAGFNRLCLAFVGKARAASA